MPVFWGFKMQLCKVVHEAGILRGGGTVLRVLDGNAFCVHHDDSWHSRWL